MPRPIMLGVVGDSATGKTTITRGLVRILGDENVVHIGTDDYHKYDRKQRAEKGITPLDPDCNHMDIMAQHLVHLRNGEPLLKPVYQHSEGTFGPPEYVSPKPFAVVEGLLGYHTSDMRDCYDVKVFLAPPEDLRRKWKVRRDTSRRGYTTDQVLEELDRREPDSEAFIRPQERQADLVVSFQESGDDPNAVDAELTLRDSLPHPDLSPIVGEGDGRNGEIELVEGRGERILRIPNGIDSERAAEIEETVWEKMHFASHLRTERLGEFTIGTDLHRSESLAIVQVLILYHLVTAKATVALGSNGLAGGEAEGKASPDEADEADEAVKS